MLNKNDDDQMISAGSLVQVVSRNGDRDERTRSIPLFSSFSVRTIKLDVNNRVAGQLNRQLPQQLSVHARMGS